MYKRSSFFNYVLLKLNFLFVLLLSPPFFTPQYKKLFSPIGTKIIYLNLTNYLKKQILISYNVFYIIRFLKHWFGTSDFKSTQNSTINETISWKRTTRRCSSEIMSYYYCRENTLKKRRKIFVLKRKWLCMKINVDEKCFVLE
jgi:hypothetical protein